MRPSRKMLIPAGNHSQIEREKGRKKRRKRTFSHREGHRNDTVHRGHTVEAADEVGEVVRNRQVVLDGDNVDFGGEEGTDDAGGVETLLDVEIRRGLVEHVAVEGKGMSTSEEKEKERKERTCRPSERRTFRSRTSATLLPKAPGCHGPTPAEGRGPRPRYRSCSFPTCS
jgi:hypothetical protein